MFRYAVMGIFALLCVSSRAPAQDNISAEEILRFLPEANYTFIAHYDFAAARVEASWPLFKHYFETRSAVLGNSRHGRNPLPDEYQGRESSLTVAQTYAMTTKEFVMVAPKEGENALGKAAEIVKGAQGVRPIGEPNADGTQLYEARIFAGDTLSVIRLQNVREIITDAVEKGYFKKSGEQIDGRVVFGFEGKDWRDSKLPMFALNSGTGEILVAGRIESLQRMLNAAAGETSILDYPEHSDLLGAISDLSQCYEIQMPPDLWEEQIQRLRETGKTDEEKIAQTQARREHFPRYMIFSYDIGEELRLDVISVYRTEDTAAATESRVKMQFSAMDKNPQLSENERELMAEITKTVAISRDGERLVVSMVLSRELVKRELQRMREQQEKLKEQIRELEERSEKKQ